jgi:hypothetical protein
MISTLDGARIRFCGTLPFLPLQVNKSRHCSKRRHKTKAEIHSMLADTTVDPATSNTPPQGAAHGAFSAC